MSSLRDNSYDQADLEDARLDAAADRRRERDRDALDCTDGLCGGCNRCVTGILDEEEEDGTDADK